MRAPHLRPGAPLGPGPRGPWSQTKVPPFLERPARSGIGQAAQEGRPRGPWSRTKVLLVRDQEGPGPLGQCPACAGQGAVLPNARKPSKGTEEAWPPPRPVRSVAETSAFCLANPRSRSRAVSLEATSRSVLLPYDQKRCSCKLHRKTCTTVTAKSTQCKAAEVALAVDPQ